jgi:hypothetical protein
MAGFNGHRRRGDDHLCGALDCGLITFTHDPSLGCNPAAIQDIWDNFGCICNTLEIAEESGMAGGNPRVALQA